MSDEFINEDFEDNLDLTIPWYLSFYYFIKSVVWRWWFTLTHFRKPILTDFLKHVYGKKIPKIFKKHMNIYDKLHKDSTDTEDRKGVYFRLK